MTSLKSIEHLSPEAQTIFARLYAGEAIYGYPDAPRIKVYMNAQNRDQVGEGENVPRTVFEELSCGGIIGSMVSIIGSERLQVYVLTGEGKFLYEQKHGGVRSRIKQNELSGLGKGGRFVTGFLHNSGRPPRPQKRRTHVTR